MERVFQALVDRNRARLGRRQLRTIFGTKHRHLRARAGQRASRVAAVLETPGYSRTMFKVQFGTLPLKGYTTGAHVLRFEAIVHTTAELGGGRVLAKFPALVARLTGILERALGTLEWLDRAFISDDTLERLPTPSRVGNTQVGGVDSGKPGMRAVLAAALALAPAPAGFTAGDVAFKVRESAGPALPDYRARHAAYDLKKLRGKQLVTKPDRSRRYQVPAAGLRTITALVVLREKVLQPLLAGLASPISGEPIGRPRGRRPKAWTSVDEHYQTLRRTMHALLGELMSPPQRQSFVDRALASA